MHRRLEAEFGEDKVDLARDIFSRYKRQDIGTGHDEVVATVDLRGGQALDPTPWTCTHALLRPHVATRMSLL